MPILIGYVIVGVVMLDLYKRKRVEMETGVNAWGYQGAAMFHKLPGERRIALVGGSAAFGLGLPIDQTPVFVFQRFLNQGWRPRYRGTLTTVVSLAEVGAAAGTYVATLEDYAYLDPDVICLYDGYAPVNGDGHGGRRASLVFQRTGYLPALAGPGASRLPASVPIAPELRDDAPGDASCGGVSAAYCAAMVNAVAWGLSHGKHVVVVTPPYVSRRHELQQASLASVLEQRFGSDTRFSYDNEGPAIDVRNRARSLDGVNLTAGGFEALAGNVVEVLRAATERP
jgi:hypothetical protein